jgi:hypothetical protein
VPRDPNDDKDVILEVKAGEGGEESALFAGDLLRMYLRFAERHGWKTEVLDSTITGLGGYKDVTVAVKARGDEGASSKLTHEVAFTASSACPPPSLRAGSTPRRPASSSCRRPTLSTSLSTRRI